MQIEKIQKSVNFLIISKNSKNFKYIFQQKRNSQFCQLRRLVFNQGSPVNPVSESRGGPLSMTHEQTNHQTEILVSNIGFTAYSIINHHLIEFPIIMLDDLPISQTMKTTDILHTDRHYKCRFFFSVKTLVLKICARKSAKITLKIIKYV